jgi:hypothetical protein
MMPSIEDEESRAVPGQIPQGNSATLLIWQTELGRAMRFVEGRRRRANRAARRDEHDDGKECS